jgi:hypothetical protein
MLRGALKLSRRLRTPLSGLTRKLVPKPKREALEPTLSNENYVGNLVYNRTSRRLGQKLVNILITCGFGARRRWTR